MFKIVFESKFSGVLVLICLIWVVSVIGFLGVFPASLSGLLPRNVSGLIGIITMPFLHGGFLHLVSNTLPFLVFSTIISFHGNKYYLKVTFLIIVFTGVMLWLFGRDAFHIGASGLVFGYFGFLLVRMFYSPSISSIIISFAVFIFYGGMIWGVLPQARHISWEGHLFGLISGIIVARIMKSSLKASH